MGWQLARAHAERYNLRYTILSMERPDKGPSARAFNKTIVHRGSGTDGNSIMDSVVQKRIEVGVVSWNVGVVRWGGCGVSPDKTKDKISKYRQPLLCRRAGTCMDRLWNMS